MEDKIKEIFEDDVKAEKLSEIIKEEVDRRVQERVKNKENKEGVNDEDEISRRSFLKKIGAGAAGLGAASLIPGASAYDIRSSDGLEVFDSNGKYFDVNPGGPVTVQNTALSVSKNIQTTGGTTIWDSSNSYIPTGRLQNKSLSIAGNSVSLGGSTSISHSDLSDAPSSAHHSKTSSASELTDVSADSITDAHHTKYTDSEASSAAPVQSVNGKTGDVSVDTASFTAVKVRVLDSNSSIDKRDIAVPATGVTCYVDSGDDRASAYFEIITNANTYTASPGGSITNTTYSESVNFNGNEYINRINADLSVGKQIYSDADALLPEG